MTDFPLHFLAFTVGAIAFLIGPMLLGALVRPTIPTPEKDAIYECGEPTIGSSYIQFDLRFYTVALLFIIFDVEVVFFFPWATVFGSAIQLSDPGLASASRVAISESLLAQPAGSLGIDQAIGSAAGLKLAWLCFADLLFFFAVLLVGFAYVWKRGDLDWVKAITPQGIGASVRPQTPTASSMESPGIPAAI